MKYSISTSNEVHSDKNSYTGYKLFESNSLKTIADKINTAYACPAEFKKNGIHPLRKFKMEDGYRKTENISKILPFFRLDCDEKGEATAIEKKLKKAKVNHIKKPSQSNDEKDWKWHFYVPVQNIAQAPDAYKLQIFKFRADLGIEISDKGVDAPATNTSFYNGDKAKMTVYDEGKDYYAEEVKVPTTPKMKPKNKTEATDKDIAEAKEMLKGLDPDMEEVEWWKVGAALYDLCPKRGHKLFDEWSQDSGKYNAYDLDGYWERFDTEGDIGDDITFGTLDFMVNGERPKPEDLFGKEKAVEATKTMSSFLNKFSMSKKELDKMSKEEINIIDNVVFAGQVISIVARPNGGKTLLAKTWAEQMATNGYNVVYVYEDSDMKGYASMVESGEKYGYSVIASYANTGVTSDDILEGMVDMVEAGEDLSKTVFILDTLKKFTDVLSKTGNKNFYTLLRQITAKGGTLILLGHCNKYLDNDGNLVYEGTGDTLADVDAMYYLYDDGDKQAETERFGTLVYDKGRAMGAIKNISYKFNLKKYRAKKLDEIIDTRHMAVQQQLMIKEANTIEAIQSLFVGSRLTPQKEIADAVTDETGLGRDKIIKILNTLTDKLWLRSKGGDTNRKISYSNIRTFKK